MHERDFSPTTGYWWKILEEAYARDRNARSIDRTTFGLLGKQAIPSPKQEAILMAVLEGLESSVSPINTVHIALELKRKNLTAEFASASMSGDKKKADKLLSDLNAIWSADGFEQEQAEWNDARATNELFDRVGQAQRIPFGCPAINNKLGGGLLPGHHVVIFGRTEVGKSTFVIDSTVRLLKSNQRVLYIGNEDQIDILKLRVVGRYLRKTQAELESADRSEVASAFSEAESNLLMTQLHSGGVDSIRERVLEWKPDVLVVDQIRNLTGAEDGMTQRMEQNAIKIRSLLLECGIVGVSVTQANDRSERHGQEPPVFLQTGDVDSSRVGLPAQADVMLGIGANRDMQARGERYISFAKNKCSSAQDAHTGLVVNFDLGISRVY